jgi:hypothetical protein
VSKISRHQFRSDFELQIAKSLADNGVNFEYESVKLTYYPTPKTYPPDFYLPDSGIYVEAKGHFTPADRMKMLLVIRDNPLIDIRMLFLRANNRLNRASKTTYGRWCDKHNILWAEGRIPDEWIKERPHE